MMVRNLILTSALLLSACGPKTPEPPPIPSPSPVDQGAPAVPELPTEKISELVAKLEQLQEILARVETPIAERRPAIQIAIAGIETFLAEGDRFLPAPVMSKIETVIDQIDQSSATDEEIPGNIAKLLEEELSALLEQVQGSDSGMVPPIPIGPGGPGPGGPGPGGPRRPGPP